MRFLFVLFTMDQLDFIFSQTSRSLNQIYSFLFVISKKINEKSRPRSRAYDISVHNNHTINTSELSQQTVKS